MLATTAATALLALASFGAASASAALHIESCMKSESECKVASVGTTFTLSSKDFSMTAGEEKEKGKEDDKCSMSMEAKVTDSTTEKAEDPMSFSVQSATFSSCTAGEIKAENLPWTWSADLPTYEKDDGGQIVKALIHRVSSGCKYSTTLTDIVRVLHLDNPPQPKFEGTLLYEGGVFCLHLTKVLATDTVAAVTDPNLPGAISVIVG